MTDDQKSGAESFDKHSMLFMSLIASMEMGAMYQLGKIVSPISGKMERDLQQAQATIDMLEALKVKTAGNLNSQEEQVLTRMLSELKMNYVDEASKPEPEKPDDSPQETPEDITEDTSSAKDSAESDS